MADSFRNSTESTILVKDKVGLISLRWLGLDIDGDLVLVCTNYRNGWYSKEAIRVRK